MRFCRLGHYWESINRSPDFLAELRGLATSRGGKRMGGAPFSVFSCTRASAASAVETTMLILLLLLLLLQLLH